MVWDAVGPFAQRRLNEALSFAIGLWAVGAGDGVVQTELMAGPRQSAWSGTPNRYR